MLPLFFAQTADGDFNAELRDAARAGNTAKVKQLLRQGANADPSDLDTYLIAAARMGHTETVKALIDAGADVNATRASS